MKKKVLFLIQDLKHGGAEKVLVNLANNLDKSKFDVYIKTLFDQGINRKSINSDVHYLPGLRWEFRGNSHLIRYIPGRILYKFFVRDSYDIIVSFLEGTATKVLSGCTDANAKRIAWVHIELSNIRTCFRTIDEAIREYSKFDRIVCVSESVRRSFESASNTCFPQMEVLYNVNETQQIIEKSKEVIDDVTFASDEINLISVAKLVPSKGYDRLIPVIDRLAKEGFNNLHLYLLGIGEEQHRLEKMISDYSLEKRISLLGFKKNPYKYVAAADIYICSSRKEGFSTAVTEALVVGTPVISTNCSGAYELLGQHNEYGIVVDNSEEGIYQGLRYFIENNRYQSYIEKSAKRGKMFSKEITTHAVEEMFIQCCDERIYQSR